MDFNELENYLSSLPDKILDDAAEIEHLGGKVAAREGMSVYLAAVVYAV